MGGVRIACPSRLLLGYVSVRTAEESLLLVEPLHCRLQDLQREDDDVIMR